MYIYRGTIKSLGKGQISRRQQKKETTEQQVGVMQGRKESDSS